MKIIAIDVSGNFKEGKGTSGVCKMIDGEVVELSSIRATDYETCEMYWMAHEMLIMNEWPDHVVIEGYRLYNHKGKSATIQANSELETPQMIGYLKMVCYHLNIPLTIQFASEIKTRWSENVLESLGILEKRGQNYYFKGKLTSTHKRDALKHALHFFRYGRKKNESQ